MRDTTLLPRRVTLADIEARIVGTKFYRIGETATVCHLTLDNGYAVCGETTCGPGQTYNQFLGEKLARDRAVGQLWPLFWFLHAELTHRSKQ